MGIAGLALVESDADGNPTKVSSYWTSKGSDIERNIVIQNGSVVTGNCTSREFFATTGTITIKDSTVEIEIDAKASSNKVFNKKPNLEGEYTAIGGSKKDKVAAYAPGKSTTYKYFKIVPGTVELIPTEATTAPTEPPVTEATTPATEATTPATVAPTEATTPATEATTPATEATTPATQAPAPTETPSDDSEGGLSGLEIALIVVGGISVLAAIALVLLWFVIKPKWLVK